ncbi:TerD family protein [Flammeovirga agarivorans]|uniref:TerD family protein n=1 Tax=Flammeovirga agarivorans TaxID=2726742 RepID=A0A7X8SJ58_9BACT|nr:TerD family protein [Flammeovirga agarivorans]NLR91196.1 TerD family protein [Flammeovirga agarivorans]
MSVTLTKKTGISLKKGSSISLIKDEGNAIDYLRVGVNWGAIEKKTLFGLLNTNLPVDLDASVTAFDHNMKEVYTVYYNKLRSTDGAIIHSGDDLDGDIGGDDGYDNETIQLELDRINKNVSQVFLYLNSYQKQDFADIPFSQVRIYSREDQIAHFDLSSTKEYAGRVSMLMGRLYKIGQNWKFEAIGQPIAALDINETIQHIQRNY